MSTNQLRHPILFRPSEHGILQVFEMTNEHSHLDNNVVFSAEDTTKSVYFYPRTYTWFEIRQYYPVEPYHYIDITITNRFTMESTRMTIRMFDDNMSFETNKVIDTKKASCVYATTVTQDQFNLIRLTLSMYDFMYGDVCLQFYNQVNKADIDAHGDPIIFQFTNAPTVFTGDIYKMLPGDTAATSAEAYDNVFSASFGTKSLNKADSGRTNVLLPTVAESECYNDFLSANRLMTNGWIDPNTERSLSGHPTYIVEYTCIVPSAFSSAFGIRQKPVDFVPFNNDEHAYLTLSADNLSAMYSDTQRLNMTTSNDAFSAHAGLTVFSATNDDSATTMDCAVRKYTAYLATSPENRHNDAWFRDHKHLCADFVLTGLDPYWTGESEELPVNIQLEYNQRTYYSAQSQYTPPVFELSWYAAGTGTVYSLLRKNGNRNNNEDWITVFDYHDYPLRNGGYAIYVYRAGDVIPDSSRVTSYNSIALTEENYHIKDSLPELELDANNRPIIKMQCGGYTYISDDVDAADHFSVLEEKTNNSLKAIVIRASDWAGVDFTLNGADAEFIIIYRV